MRSMGEGHARCFLSFMRNAAPPVPPHHLRWSPSPFRGGAAAIGRKPPPEKVSRCGRKSLIHAEAAELPSASETHSAYVGVAIHYIRVSGCSFPFSAIYACLAKWVGPPIYDISLALFRMSVTESKLRSRTRAEEEGFTTL